MAIFPTAVVQTNEIKWVQYKPYPDSKGSWMGNMCESVLQGVFPDMIQVENCNGRKYKYYLMRQDMYEAHYENKSRSARVTVWKILEEK